MVGVVHVVHGVALVQDLEVDSREDISLLFDVNVFAVHDAGVHVGWGHVETALSQNLILANCLLVHESDSESRISVEVSESLTPHRFLATIFIGHGIKSLVS